MLPDASYRAVITCTASARSGPARYRGRRRPYQAAVAVLAADVHAQSMAPDIPVRARRQAMNGLSNRMVLVVIWGMSFGGR